MYLEGTIFVDENYENKNDQTYNKFLKDVDKLLDTIENAPSPRLIKSHLPGHLLPKDIWTVKPKLIYTYRNAKDVAISMYHIFRNFSFTKYRGSMEDYCDIFLNDHVIYAPFYAHVNGFRKIQHLDHVLLVSYDEMIVDSFHEIKKISEFLGFSYTDDQLEQLTQHVSFANMHKSFENKGDFYEKDFKYI